MLLHYIRGSKGAKKLREPYSHSKQLGSQPAALQACRSLSCALLCFAHCFDFSLRGSGDGAVEDFTRLDDSVRHVVSHRVEREADVLCSGNRNATKNCHSGMVSQYLVLKIVGVDSPHYAITVDCIMEGKGDVRWMKCSHTKNFASLFPFTCVYAWYVSPCSQTGLFCGTAAFVFASKHHRRMTGQIRK